MEDKKFKNIISYVLLAVLCSFLFATSGVWVLWLETSFTAYGQIVVRAVISIIVSLVWTLGSLIVNKLPIKYNKMSKEYDKWQFIKICILRPLGNFCFIMAATAGNVTLAVMVLLSVKMLTNLRINFLKDKEKLPPVEIIGYVLVFVGILIYGLFAKEVIFSSLLLWAVGSGFFEAYRLEIVKGMKIDPIDKPQFALIEFSGMLVVAVLALVVLGGAGVFLPGVSTISTLAWMGILLATTSVAIVALDYYLVNYLPTGIYSAVLATEVGFSGLLNHWAFPDTNPWEFPQKLALAITVIANIFIGISIAKREDKKKKVAEKAVVEAVALLKSE